MRHLTPDELIDAVEQSLSAMQTTHLESCALCQQEVAQLSAVLRDVRIAAVPEPSPLFWDRLSHRVRTAIDAEPVTGGLRWRQLFRWPVLAPLGALALVLVALASVIRVTETPSLSPNVVANAPSEAEESWALVSDIVSTFDLESIQEAGVATPIGSADRAVLGLSTAEQQELVRLLEQELKEAGS